MTGRGFGQTATVARAVCRLLPVAASDSRNLHFISAGDLKLECNAAPPLQARLDGPDDPPGRASWDQLGNEMPREAVHLTRYRVCQRLAAKTAGDED